MPILFSILSSFLVSPLVNFPVLSSTNTAINSAVQKLPIFTIEWYKYIIYLLDKFVSIKIVAICVDLKRIKIALYGVDDQ